jgi:nucleoside-diphosphate-sugar epimerase
MGNEKPFNSIVGFTRKIISPLSLGPNEARILFDFFVACGGLLIAVAFTRIFIGQPVNFLLLLMPPALLACNALVGIYSRFRTSRGRIKAAILAVSVSVVSAFAYAVTHDLTTILLWATVVGGQVCMARILLSLPYSKHKNIATIVVRQRGPVLVVGGAGYIGTHTVEMLLEQGYSVRVLDRLMYGKQPISDFLGHRNFELVEGDATDIVKLAYSMKDASAVIYLAGLVGDPACAVDASFTRHANVISTRMAKDAAQSMGIYRFVFASSCSVYGVSDQEVREGDRLNPVSLYAQTKIDSETELLSSIRDDFFVTILRFATVFGHSRRPRFDLVGNLFTAQAMMDGLITVIGPQQWRPFVHVRDLGRSIVAVVKADPRTVQSQIFNVGDKKLNMTILQLAETVQQVVASEGRSVQISITENPEDRRNYVVSFEKIRSVLGFEAETGIEDGVREMAENFKKGNYGTYTADIYSNLKMTRKVLTDFQDPIQSMILYAPLDFPGRVLSAEPSVKSG